MGVLLDLLLFSVGSSTSWFCDDSWAVRLTKRVYTCGIAYQILSLFQGDKGHPVRALPVSPVKPRGFKRWWDSRCSEGMMDDVIHSIMVQNFSLIEPTTDNVTGKFGLPPCHNAYIGEVDQ